MQSWSELVEAAKREGFSVQLTSGEIPVDGYMVALAGHEEIIPAQALTVDRLRRYVGEHFDALCGEGYVYLGAWREGDDVYLDVSERVTDKARAVELGAERGQLAVWAVLNSAEIDTTLPALRS
jgi:hypothetical protein